MEKKIAMIPGAGIGAEVLAEADKVLRSVATRFGHRFETVEVSGGANAPLAESELAVCTAADSVLAGIGTGEALRQLTAALHLQASMRPALLYPQLAEASPLAPTLVSGDIDLMLVQALDSMAGPQPAPKHGKDSAQDTLVCRAAEAERAARIAFRTAELRRGGVVFVEQPGAPNCNQLWREVVQATAQQFPRVSVSVQTASATASQLLREPAQFDVILADGICAEFLAGEAAGLTGCAGMMSCAMLGAGSRGLYHPVLGPSPDMAGQNLANPVGAVFAAAMLLKYAFGLTAECAAIEQAVQKVLDDGYRTVDILAPGCRLVSCDRFGDLITAALTSPALYRKVARSVKAAGDGFVPLRRRVAGAAEL